MVVLAYFLKVIISTVFLMVGFFFLHAIVQIRSYVQSKNQEELKLKQHRFLMRVVLFLVLAGVLLVETFVSLVGRERSWLLWLHLGFAVPFLLLLLDLNFFHTGLRSPSLHRKLGYLCILMLYLGMSVTGAILLFSKAG